jgi:hypothetical protein
VRFGFLTIRIPGVCDAGHCARGTYAYQLLSVYSIGSTESRGFGGVGSADFSWFSVCVPERQGGAPAEAVSIGFRRVAAQGQRSLLARPDPPHACRRPSTAPMLPAWLGGCGFSRPQVAGLDFPLL